MKKKIYYQVKHPGTHWKRCKRQTVVCYIGEEAVGKMENPDVDRYGMRERTTIEQHSWFAVKVVVKYNTFNEQLPLHAAE